MKHEQRTEYVARDRIMRLLSDAEVATVSTAETAPRLSAGDEYVDLENLDRGVQRAAADASMSVGKLLPRKAVQDATWIKIVAQLGAASVRPN